MVQNFPQRRTVTNLKNQKAQNIQAKLIKRYPYQIHHRETQNAKDIKKFLKRSGRKDKLTKNNLKLADFSTTIMEVRRLEYF